MPAKPKQVGIHDNVTCSHSPCTYIPQTPILAYGMEWDVVPDTQFHFLESIGVASICIEKLCTSQAFGSRIIYASLELFSLEIHYFLPLVMNWL